jgi:hypothetical protein
MNTRTLLSSIAAACMVAALGAYAPVSANGAPAPVTAHGWTANGASACEKYLTPDIVGAILSKAPGPAVRIDAASCNTGSIYVSLLVADVDVFKQEISRIVGAHPMTGVGDAAFWNQAGALSSVKGHDRGCNISVIGEAYATKLHDEALARKLGEVCNKLFALP